MKRDFTVVLVRPRDPNNIGAAARAMANFGLSDLRVVEPYEPSWKTAVVSAVGANDILQKAKLFHTLPDALSDCKLTIATTALKNRRLNETIVLLPDFPAWLDKQPAGKTALVFGNEKTGLSNEDIELCSAALHISTRAKQPSINLAQAVILTCYELARGQVPPRGKSALKVATFEQTELVVNELDKLMQAADFRQDYTATQRKALIRKFFQRGALSKDDLFFLKKFAGKLGDKLKK